MSPIQIFELLTGLEELIDLSIVQTNLYAQQKGINVSVDNNKLKAFLRINYFTMFNKLPTITEYWKKDNVIAIENTMVRNSFCKIRQNLHFADNTFDD